MVNETLFAPFFTAFRNFFEVGGGYVGFALTGSPVGVEVPDNAVNPAWRGNVLHMIPATTYAVNATLKEQAADNVVFTEDWLAPVRNATPGGGAYLNEADPTEPNFQQSYFGEDTYERLLRVKGKYDPTDLFYAHQAVGSDAWYITDQIDGLPTQNGRLCRVSS